MGSIHFQIHAWLENEQNITMTVVKACNCFYKSLHLFLHDNQKGRAIFRYLSLLGEEPEKENYLQQCILVSNDLLCPLSLVPWQTVPKLVSAMKGSRAQQGTLPKMNLCVKWSPDVYDPPPTSESHTVLGHRHRPKSTKKDYYKHKHTKGKSSRGSGGNRKHAYKRSAIKT